MIKESGAMVGRRTPLGRRFGLDSPRGVSAGASVKHLLPIRTSTATIPTDTCLWPSRFAVHLRWCGSRHLRRACSVLRTGNSTCTKCKAGYPQQSGLRRQVEDQLSSGQIVTTSVSARLTTGPQTSRYPAARSTPGSAPRQHAPCPFLCLATANDPAVGRGIEHRSRGRTVIRVACSTIETGTTSRPTEQELRSDRE